MKSIILTLSILFADGLLFVNIYTSIVDARSWAADIPNSIAAARAYAKKYNPGTFFRAFSPVNQLLALVALVICWQVPGVRLYTGIAFVLYILVDVLTFVYFYPRNALIFEKADLTDTTALTKTCKEWSTMNWVRSLVILVGICSSLMAMFMVVSNSK